MNPFGKYSNRGMTLIEVLATIVVSSIIIGSVYGVFITGIKAYKKIGVESELKNEADYIISMMLNEIYKLSPDEIANCGDNCITLTNNEKMQSKEIKNEDDKIIGYSIKKREITDIKETIIKIENNDFKMGNPASPAAINSTQIDIMINEDFDHLGIDKTEFEESSITFDCVNYEKGNCKGAIIKVTLTLQKEEFNDPEGSIYVKPITFKSSFSY